MLNGGVRMRGGLFSYVVLCTFAASWAQAALAVRPDIGGWRYAEGAVGLGGSLYALRGIYKAARAKTAAESNYDIEGERRALNKMLGHLSILAASALLGLHAANLVCLPRSDVSGWRYAEGAVGLVGSIYAIRGLHKAILAQEDAERDSDTEGVRRAHKKILGYTLLMATSFLLGSHAAKPDLFQSSARRQLGDYTPALRGEIALARAREEQERIKREVEKSLAAQSAQGSPVRVLRKRGG